MGTPITWLEGVADGRADRLTAAGYETAEDVQNADVGDLCAIDGIGERSAVELSNAEIVEPDTDMIDYRITINRDDWEAFKETHCQHTPAEREVRSLIRRATQEPATNPDAEKLAAIRARRHAMIALQSIPKSNTKAKDAVNEISRLMDRIL